MVALRDDMSTMSTSLDELGMLFKWDAGDAGDWDCNGTLRSGLGERGIAH